MGLDEVEVVTAVVDLNAVRTLRRNFIAMTHQAAQASRSVSSIDRSAQRSAVIVHCGVLCDGSPLTHGTVGPLLCRVRRSTGCMSTFHSFPNTHSRYSRPSRSSLSSTTRWRLPPSRRLDDRNCGQTVTVCTDRTARECSGRVDRVACFAPRSSSRRAERIGKRSEEQQRARRGGARRGEVWGREGHE